MWEAITPSERIVKGEWHSAVLDPKEEVKLGSTRRTELVNVFGKVGATKATVNHHGSS